MVEIVGLAVERGASLSHDPHESSEGAGGVIRVFVHLARDKDAESWRKAKAEGRLVGINDDTPYGYGRAERMGCRVAFSRSRRESRAEAIFRLALRAALGFDLVHAWRQRAAIVWADVVWTHTESQYLAVAAVVRKMRKRPLLLGQSVWLMDSWPSLSPAHRALFRHLARNVDVLTFHSPLNLKLAERVFAGQRLALAPFGIPAESATPPRRRESSPVRVLALGADRHRDWGCLIDAIAGMPDMKLRILSGAVAKRVTRGAANVEIGRALTQQELLAAYEEATVVCAPLRPNLHASGLTVIQEAVLAGLPVVATDTGGLDAYFARDEIKFVPAGDASALRAAIRELAADPEAALAQAKRAQARMTSGEIGAEAYIRRHVELTREMLTT
jgi:glycosyltransferase involved in cell wall biosynthesis